MDLGKGPAIVHLRAISDAQDIELVLGSSPRVKDSLSTLDDIMARKLFVSAPFNDSHIPSSTWGFSTLIMVARLSNEDGLESALVLF